MGVIAHKSAVGFSGVFLNDNGHMQCDREITSIFSLLSSTRRETRTIWGNDKNDIYLALKEVCEK
ncbi:Uncharacterised protein [Aggregatibacter aphrophilus]|uniref:Uncharacterized protein n=1 Tax=Aggregatibacter aphrophilus TaxID=732 RepID=A0A336NBP3_AGGAP|nr:hypothetical protein ATCC33389_0200050 [Aggregatibacter aphrophilus ATCC 33389]OBY54828.1 hypothetical protein BBB51_03550 [Aggregatibacter aphrophilus]RDE84138.1 hypothetical protein DPW00_10155 [Aggregatibacter aphrophilus]SSZ30458.1 Uncharacterised protein [Aggregatibacter aphrophilus]